MSPSSNDVIDLRSDTVTRPSEAKRAAMAAAPVGDDQFGEDPTVNLLQERVAALLGVALAGVGSFTLLQHPRHTSSFELVRGAYSTP